MSKYYNNNFIIGVFLSIVTLLAMAIPYNSNKIENKVVSSFLVGLFGVSAIASFRRASDSDYHEKP